MQELRCGKAIVRINGKYDAHQLRRDTVEFLKKAERSQQRRGNKDTTRAIGKK